MNVGAASYEGGREADVLFMAERNAHELIELHQVDLLRIARRQHRDVCLSHRDLRGADILGKFRRQRPAWLSRDRELGEGCGAKGGPARRGPRLILQHAVMYACGNPVRAQELVLVGDVGTRGVASHARHTRGPATSDPPNAVADAEVVLRRHGIRAAPD